MHHPLLPLLLLPLTLATPPSPLTIHYSPLTSLHSPPLPLAHLTLHPLPTLNSFTPPPLPPNSHNLPSADTLIRLSFTPASTRSTSTLTTLPALHAPHGTFRLLLSPISNATISLSYHTHPSPRTIPPGTVNGTTTPPLPAVEIAYPSPPPRPVLNRPVELDEAGKVAMAEEPKGLLQRYWWVLLAMAVLAVAGSGEAK